MAIIIKFFTASCEQFLNVSSKKFCKKKFSKYVKPPIQSWFDFVILCIT